MAKRGMRATHRVVFRWANGVSGKKPFFHIEDAQFFYDGLQKRSKAIEMDIEAHIEPIASKT